MRASFCDGAVCALLCIKNHGEGKKERIRVIEEGLHRVGLVKPGCVLREAVPCGREGEPRPRSAASPRDVRVAADKDGGKVHRDPHGSDLGDDVVIHPVVLDERLADLGIGAALLFVGGEPVQEAVVVRRGVPELLGASEHASVRGEHPPLLGVVDNACLAEAVAVEPRERAEGDELEERPEGNRPVRVLPPDESPGVRGARHLGDRVLDVLRVSSLGNFRQRHRGFVGGRDDGGAALEVAALERRG